MLGFDPGPVRVGSVSERVAQGHVFLPVLLLSRIITSVLYTQPYI